VQQELRRLGVSYILAPAAGWQTARVQRPVAILGRLDGVMTGVRQLRRAVPLETETIAGLRVPTLAAAPSDAPDVDLSRYKGLVAPWNDWAHLSARGRHFAAVLAQGLLAGGRG
jgi:hypothetical protein